MISPHDDAALRKAAFEFSHPVPVEAHDRRLCFQEDRLGIPRAQRRPKGLRRHPARDAIQPQHLVPMRLQQGGRTCGHHGINGRWAAEPLELAVLRQQRNAFGRRNWGVTKGNTHDGMITQASFSADQSDSATRVTPREHQPFRLPFSSPPYLFLRCGASPPPIQCVPMWRACGVVKGGAVEDGTVAGSFSNASPGHGENGGYTIGVGLFFSHGPCHNEGPRWAKPHR